MIETPDYNIVRTIGSGSFGYVFEAINRKTNKRVALKRIQKVGKGMSRENQILYMLKGCPNVIQIEDLFYSNNEKGKLVQNIVFQYIEDNLQNVIQKTSKKGISIEVSFIKSTIYQILRGLKFIHEKKIVHRDLKPQNILLNKTGEIKICDFGCSKIINPNGKNTPYAVSQYYRAPQLIMGITNYSTSIDIWSVGCIMAEMAILEAFFVGANEGDQLFAILKVLGSMSLQDELIYRKRVPFDEKMMESFRGYKQIALQLRFGAIPEKALFIDLLKKMLQYLPQKRVTATQAMNHAYFQDLKKQEFDLQ